MAKAGRKSAKWSKASVEVPKSTMAPVQGDPTASTRTTVARQLVSANQDLKAVYETEHQWRLDLLKANEDLSRETVAVEAEVRRLQQEGLILKGNLTELVKQRDSLLVEDKSLSGQYETLKSQTDKARTERDHLDSTVKDLTRDRESLSKHVAELGKELARLKADVERLEALRKEYLNQIAKFRSEKAKLVEE